MKRPKNGLKPFFTLLSTNVPKLTLTLGLAGNLLSTLVNLTIPFLTGRIVDYFSLESLSIGILLAIVAAFVLHALIEGLSTYWLGKVGQSMVARLRKNLWSKIILLPVRYFDQTESGKTVSRVVNDTGIVKELITQHFPHFVGGLVSITGAVIILIIMDWKMTVMMLTAVPVSFLLILPLGKRMAQIARGMQDETAHFTSIIQQAISEQRLMKASTAEKVEERKGYQGIERLFRFGLKEAKIHALVSPLMYLIVMLVIVLIIGYGGIRVAQGSMSTGELVAFLLYLFQIIFPITSFASFFTQLQKAKGATERIIELLELPVENGQDGLEMDIGHKPIRFHHVFFAYQKDEPVLEDITFEALPGQMIAFVGPSGSGKTTLFGLLERFYEPTEGEIRIGNIPISALSLQSWRKQIGYVPQDSPLMAGTIRENLCYGLENAREISDEQLWEVAKMAFADPFIKSFKKGLDTEVGERGVKLSGGQRQRIAIARAFLRDPKILLLDEATASLDSQSEQVVQDALFKLMEGRTTFVIAHRLSTIVRADKIIFIEKGKITGMGTHHELIQTHPLYKEYAEHQLV